MRGLLATAACLILLAVVLVVAARGDTAGDTATVASAGVTPIALPRDGFAPAQLRVAFKSIPAAGAPTPELRRIALEIGEQVRFGSGLPSCPLVKLYEKANPCPQSVVGHGTVASEITPPGGQPTAAKGTLVAYFNQTHRQSRVLARVETGKPLSLTYVIPFSIKPAAGLYGSELVVARMRRIVGKCTASHPNCFAQPYTLKGVYGHISDFRMVLARDLSTGAGRRSFVEASCPAEPGHNDAVLAVMRATLTYADGSEGNGVVPQFCKVRPAAGG